MTSADEIFKCIFFLGALRVNIYECSIPKRESSFQTKHFICICGWGKTGTANSYPPPPPKWSDLSIYLSFQFYVILLLYLKTYE